MNVVGLDRDVVAVSAGYRHTCAVTSSGGIKCWGFDGTTVDSSIPVDVDGLGKRMVAVAAGGFHTCALDVEGGVKCWGSNESGQLGDGTTTNSLLPVEVSGLNGHVTAVVAGEKHSCALAGSGRAKCWGSDEWYGQLGTGVALHHWTPVNVLEHPGFLTLNYSTGKPGSFFTISGWDFPANGIATLSINDQIITDTLQVNPTGSFILFLDSSGADAGYYNVTISTSRSAFIRFYLSDSAPLRVQEGGGQTFTIPAGIAHKNLVYIPFVRR